MKVLAKIHELTVLAQLKAEEITGAFTGGTVGILTYRALGEVAITLILAIATGFLGGFGAWLFRQTIKKYYGKDTEIPKD